MAQEKIKINNTVIYQPDEDLGYDFETTYSEDTTRVISGKLNATPLFTVERLSYSASNIPAADAATILQKIAKGQKYDLYYFSPYYGTWRTAKFYTPSGAISIKRVKQNDEWYSSLSFSMTGVNPI